MKIFKLSKAEMQKIYARPGIFIMAFLFIVIIAASAFIYNLAPRANGIVTIPGSSVSDIYTSYSSPVSSESKTSYDALLQSVEDVITAYATPSTAITDLNAALTTVSTYYTSYSVSINTSYPDAQIDVIKHNLKNALISFKDLYNDIYDETYSSILIAEQTHIELLQFISTCENTITEDDEADNTIILNNLNALDFLNVIEDKLNTIQPFAVNASVITALNDYYLTEVNTRLTSIQAEIVAFNTSNSLSEEAAELLHIRTLISNYKLTIQQFETIALNSMYLNAFEGYSNQALNAYVGYEEINLYELKEDLTRNIYLFETQDFSYNYANNFNIASPSNASINAFDFAYFTLELFSFVIIVYVVVLGAGMIAGEEANGTMKLLAMRPYRRHKIFLGKLLAALKVAFMFLIIGGMVSILTGTYLFGASSLPILAIFNTQYVLVMSPYFMFAIYLMTLFLEIMFYTIIAVSISSIFKSYTGAVTISILIYFISMILSFVSGVGFLKYIPLTNTNLFKYFGSSFVDNLSATGLNSLLTPPILIDTDFNFSAILLGGTMMIFLIVAIRIFSKRDLK